MGFLRYIVFTFLFIVASAATLLAQGPFTLNIGSTSGQVGDIVCVDVTVEGFNNIASMEWFNRWNSNMLRLDTILVDASTLNENGANLLPGGSSSFNFLPASSKYGKFTWIDPSVTGVTIPTGSLLYTVCFEIIGDPCDVAVVDITGGDNAIGIEAAISEDISIELDQSLITVNSGTITINPAGFVISESHCSSDDNSNSGSITFAGAGGNGPYSWTISGGGVNESNLPGEEIDDCETATVDGLGPGTYTITFTDADNVIRNEVITIESNSDFPFILTLDSMDPRCFDKNNGEISIANLEGGDAPFTYEWSNSQFTETIEDLFPGDYALTVTDANGCTTAASTTLSVDTVKVEVNIISDPSCDGNADGIVSFSTSGGTPYPNGGYDYDIDGISPTFYIGNGNEIVGPFSPANFFEGCYVVVVNDALNCQSDEIEFCLEAGVFSGLTIDSTNVSCFGECDGAVIITAGNSGNYSFQIFDELGTGQVGITSPTTFTKDDFCPGVYTARVTDVSDGCFIDTMFTIAEPLELELMVLDSMGPGCGGGDGFISFDGAGGTAPYSFIWEDTFDQSTRQNMPGGNYSVTIEDNNGCRDSIMWTFAEGGDIGLNAGVLQAVTCESAADGSVRATVTVAGAFTFSWEDEDGLPLGDGEIINNLSGGIYFVTATDGLCTDTASVILAPGQTPSATVVMVAPTCTNTTDGMLTATLSDGVAPAMFEWSVPPNNTIISSGPVVTGGIGTYNLHIVDNNGCEADQLFEILPPADQIQIVVSDLTDNLCFGECSASGIFTASDGPSGTGDYTFIVNGDATASNNMLAVTNLCAGTNYVLAFDGSCVSDTVFFEVNDADEILINLDNSMINPPNCFGDNDGSISVVITGGNDTNYDLLWLNEGIADNELNNLEVGQYILQITDGNGCVVNDTVDLFTPDPLTVVVNPLATVDISCFTGAMGRISLLTSGGNAGELTFDWSPAVSTTSVADGLSPGLYSVTVSDVNGCSAETSYELTSAPPIVATIPTPAEPECFGEQTCIEVTSVSGGVGNNYTFTINNGPRLPVDSCFSIFAGPYLITVFDSAGCAVDTMITIEQPEQITVDLGDDIMIDLGTESDPVSAFIVSEFDIDTISWSPNVDIECNTSDCQVVTFSPNESTTYTVTVTDENGCLATDDINVVVDLARNVFTANIFSPNLDNNNDNFQLAVGNGVVQVTYLKIFDRWGNLVYIDENYMPNDNEHKGWDGTLNGGESETGVYVYFAEVEFIDGVSVVYKGDVTLVR